MESSSRNEEWAWMLTENSRHGISKDLVRYRMGPDTRMTKGSTKKRTRQRHRIPQWDWVEDLCLSQENKLNHTLVSFEAASPELTGVFFYLAMRGCFRSWEPRLCFHWGVWYFSISAQETIPSCGQSDSLDSFTVPPHNSRGPEVVNRSTQRTWRANVEDWSPLWPSHEAIFPL